jgi:hypothetical protein
VSREPRLCPAIPEFLKEGLTGMGLRTTGFLGKIIKIVILCVAVYFLLLIAQRSMDFLTTQTEQELTRWELQKEWYIKYPIFAIIAYLVLNESI